MPENQLTVSRVAGRIAPADLNHRPFPAQSAVEA